MDYSDFLEQDTPQEEVTPKTKVTQKSGGTTTTTTEQKSGLEEVDINSLYGPLEEAAKTDYEARRKNINDEYDPYIKDVSDLLSAAEQKKAKLSEKDEAARRRDKAYSLVAGLGDAMSGVANLVGTTKGAVAQTQSQALPSYMAKADEMRKERKLDKETIEARRKELESQRKALRQSKGKALTEAYEDYKKEIRGLGKAKADAEVAAGKGTKTTTVTKETEPSTTTTTGGGSSSGSGSGGGKGSWAKFYMDDGSEVNYNVSGITNWESQAEDYLSRLFKAKDPAVAEYQSIWDENQPRLTSSSSTIRAKAKAKIAAIMKELKRSEVTLEFLKTIR